MTIPSAAKDELAPGPARTNWPSALPTEPPPVGGRDVEDAVPYSIKCPIQYAERIIATSRAVFTRVTITSAPKDELAVGTADRPVERFQLA